MFFSFSTGIKFQLLSSSHIENSHIFGGNHQKCTLIHIMHCYSILSGYFNGFFQVVNVFCKLGFNESSPPSAEIDSGILREIWGLLFLNPFTQSFSAVSFSTLNWWDMRFLTLKSNACLRRSVVVIPWKFVFCTIFLLHIECD